MKETIEEFCIEFVKKHFEDERTYNPSSIITAMKVSAKWQQKNGYSEEDMRGMYDKSCGLIGLGQLDDQTENDKRFRELIFQFKKK